MKRAPPAVIPVEKFTLVAKKHPNVTAPTAATARSLFATHPTGKVSSCQIFPICQRLAPPAENGPPTLHKEPTRTTMNFYQDVNWPFHIFFTAFFLGAGLLFLFLDQKRRRAMRNACHALGLHPHRSFPEAALKDLQRFGLFTDILINPDTLHVTGRYQQRRNLLLFDLNYRSTNPSDFPSLVLLCMVVDLDAPVPPITLMPTAWAEQNQADPGEGRFYPDQPELTETFQIYCDNFKFAHTLTDQVDLTWLTQPAPCYCETRGSQVLLARPGGLFPHDLAGHGDWAERAAAAFAAAAKSASA